MIEEQKANNAACEAFEQHRFKGHLCVHCFKPKAAHAVEGEKIAALDNNINESQGTESKPIHYKYDIPKVILRNQNNLQKDGTKGRGEKPTDRNNRKKVKERVKPVGPQSSRRDASGKPPDSNVIALNIPVDAPTPASVDNVASVNSESMRGGMNVGDSSSESGSVNVNLPVQEPNGNILLNSSSESEADSGLSSNVNKHLRRALRPVQKPASPPKNQERNSRDPDLPEFVKVAKNLRHIQTLNTSAGEVHSSNNNNHSMVEPEVTLTDLPDLPNVIGSDGITEDQQRLVEVKTKLSSAVGHIVLNSQTTLTGHETLPKNIGKVRPSIQPLTKHRRQTSDPVVFIPSEKEEISVNVSKDVSEMSDDIQTENVMVRNSELSSDVYFGKPSGQSTEKHSVDIGQEDLVPRYGHVADCVTIISMTGEVSHRYNGESSSGSSMRQDSGTSHQSQDITTSPYRVVDLGDNQSGVPEGESILEVKGHDMPSSSNSSNRLSQELDEGVGLAQQEDTMVQSKDPSARFTRRNVALVDGIYTTSQFQTDSGINDSMESSDSSDGPKPEGDRSKRNSPPYPIILHDEQPPEYRKKKRNSGQYKVPIFILPKGYDGGAARSSHKGEVVSHVTPSSPVNIDYLQPKENSTESDGAVSHPVSEDEVKGTSAPNLLESKKVSLSNESLQETRRPSRSRSRTHPVMEEPASSSTDKEDQANIEFVRTRQKRVAPRPPSMELVDQVTSRERDDRLDSLPHRSPPPPPLSKKDSKQSVDRSSSDLSDDTDRSSHPHAASDHKGKFEAPVASSSGRSDQWRREMSPTRRTDVSPERRGDATPVRTQHEPRKVTPAKKESNLRARLREFSPTGRAEQSRGKQKDVAPNMHQPVRRVASPPPPLNRPHPNPINLPDSTATQDAPAIISKVKKSKLPWRRKKKRDEPGSPEREFNSEEVEKWLKNSFPATASSPTPGEPVQRNSLERLEVINAYKGEPTVAIKRVAPTNSTPTPTSAATPPMATPTTSVINTPALAATPPKRSVGAEEETMLVRNAANSASKRRAPKPPVSPDPEDVDSGETPVLLQKSYSLSPTSRRKIPRGAGDEPLYENLGASRAKITPQKPARRRHRNRTTGFEDMPSRVKRMAPKTPEKPTSRDTDGSDEVDGVVPLETAIQQHLPEDTPLSSSPPLKSALRSAAPDQAKTDTDGKAIPKRPVRIVAPEDEAIITDLPRSTVLRSDYKNLALVPQADLDDALCKDAETQMEENTPAKMTVNADTQCNLSGAGASFLDQTSQQSLLFDISAVHIQALSQLSTPRVRMDTEGMTTMEDIAWKDQVLPDTEPHCRSAGAAFFGLTLQDGSAGSPGLMVCCNPSKTSQVLHMADITRSMFPQPNLISVSHAAKDTVTINPSLLEQRKSRGSPQPDGSFETAVIITDCLPAVNVAEYVTQNAEKHECLPDVYERDVATMLLQLCQGLCQLQSHHMCLESLKLDHLLLVNSGLPGGGQRLVINHLIGAEVVTAAPVLSPAEGGVASKLEQKCHEFDVGILVYEFLHHANPFSTRTSLIISDYAKEDLPHIPVKSPLSQGLHTIACKLLTKKPEDRLTCDQAVTLLQCLLWGPPATFLTENAATPGALDGALERWLAVERANAVSQMAISALLGSASQEGGVSLSDQLKCQFLAKTTVSDCKRALDVLYGGTSSEDVAVIDTGLDL
ncbi:uncharacterized protein [Diadema setosum]|uniref:uncharacterized protein n=1 Tax=Diadema setosum TaxID=31175 RepID=UPI003B3AED6E